MRRAFRPVQQSIAGRRCFANITDNVSFDTIAREWRCTFFLTLISQVIVRFYVFIMIDVVYFVFHRTVCIIFVFEKIQIGKWSADNDKASLSAAQDVLQKHIGAIKAVDGIKDVKRIVCGGCLDFKVIAAVDGEKWGAFESGGHGPEAAIIKELSAIPGITNVETQTFTYMNA